MSVFYLNFLSTTSCRRLLKFIQSDHLSKFSTLFLINTPFHSTVLLHLSSHSCACFHVDPFMLQFFVCILSQGLFHVIHPLDGVNPSTTFFTCWSYPIRLPLTSLVPGASRPGCLQLFPAAISFLDGRSVSAASHPISHLVLRFDLKKGALAVFKFKFPFNF